MHFGVPHPHTHTHTHTHNVAQEIAVSSGSACTSASLEPSYVLRALGVEEDMAHTSIRFGFGRFTTDAEVAPPPRKSSAGRTF